MVFTIPNNGFFDEKRIAFDYKPDLKLTSVYLGLKSYFQTYGIWNEYWSYFQETSTEIVIVKSHGHKYLLCYFQAITFLHLSFEYFLLEILEECVPNLSWARVNDTEENNLVQLLIAGQTSFRQGNFKIKTSLARKWVLAFIENHNDLPAQHQVNPKYHFLKKHIDTLALLANLRNDLSHSGETILNRYMFECLFVNKLLPLIRDFLDSQPPATLLERNQACLKNVIDEITIDPLPENYNDFANYDRLKKSLRRINQFKELGRASYSNPIDMFEGRTEEVRKKQEEDGRNYRETIIAKLYSAFKVNKLYHYKSYRCPCCGMPSLTTHTPMQRLSDGFLRMTYAECSTCTYRIDEGLGEPKEFAIMSEELFIEIKYSLISNLKYSITQCLRKLFPAK